jgi:hypothetical protein
MLRPALLVVGTCALLACSPQLAMAQPPAPAGRVKVASGTAEIVRAGQVLPAPVGTEVFAADVLRTGADGRLAVMLRDETRLSLGPGSEVALAAFDYSPSDSQLGLTLKMARGILSYVSGIVAKLAPASVNIQTPTAVIGVRGTHALVRADVP